MLWFRKNTRPVFVLGCQRSGTTICQNIFLRSSDCDVFREGNRHAMTVHWRLRDDESIRGLIRKSRREIALFKPLNDSQLADHFLSDFEDARLIWIYRDPWDTANSAVAKWGESQRDMIVTIGRKFHEFGNSEGAVEALKNQPGSAACAERVTDDSQRQLIDWSQLDLDPHSGAAAMWWLRNRFFTELRLGDDPRVLLVRYESLVSDPATEAGRMCEHMRIPYDDSLIETVHAKSVGRNPRPTLEPSVEAACVELKEQMDAVNA